jgi:CHAT domain-containing protein/tetratricopeptide (TPR) repeat protein
MRKRITSRTNILISLALLLACLSFGQSTDRHIAEKYGTIADSLGNIPEYKDAILYYKKALNIYQSMRPPPYEEVVSIYRNIGLYLRRTGQLSQSEYYQKRAVELADKGLPPGHIEQVKAYNSYAIFLLTKGDYSRSLEFLEKALAISQSMNYDEVGNQFNNIGIVYENLGNYNEALKNYRGALSFNREKYGLYAEETANNYFNLGTLSSNMRQLDEAIAYFDTTRIIYDSILTEGEMDYARLYNNIGATYNNKGDFHKAVDYLEMALKIFAKHPGADNSEMANTYANTGLLLLDRGDLETALTYFLRAYGIRLRIFGPHHHLVARTCNYIGNVLLEKKDYDGAYEWLNRALLTYQFLPGFDPNEKAELLNDTGYYFEKKENYRNALRYYEEALQLIRQGAERLSADQADAAARIGDVYLQQKKLPLAEKYFQQALIIRLKIYGKSHPDVADVYAKLALSCAQDEICAMDYCDSAYVSIGYNPNHMQPFAAVSSPIRLLGILQTRAALLSSYYDSTGTAKYLFAADSILRQALRLINFIKNSFDEPASRIALLDNYFQIYEKAIAVKDELKKVTGDAKYWEEAFYISEQSNAIILNEALHAVDAEEFAGIPDSLLSQDRQLKIDLAFLEKQLFEENLKGANRDMGKTNRLNDRIFALKMQQENLLRKLRNDYPAYFELRYNAKQVTVRDLQKNVLWEDQTQLSYFVGEDNIYAFVLSAGTFNMVHIKKDFPLESWTEDFCNSIYRFNPGSRDFDLLNQKYANIGHELYQLIFEPVQPFIHNERLVIIPGGVLGYLPFEALLTAPATDYNRFDTQDFLLKKYQISYCYSATLLQEVRRKKGSGDRFVAFAPSYGGDTLNIRSDPWKAILGSLKYNQQEVKNIQKIMGGKAYLNGRATEAQFIKSASGADILHLATHGKANDQHGEYSYLAFYQTSDSVENELVFVKDLYNMRLRASLVVLSACETGVGEFQRGEGIVSLARGFFYAGASSIVTTLWSIDDNASAEIMVSFYKNLKDGLPKDEALRAAKLDYLGRMQNTNRSHPLFWAAFVPVGNMEPLPASGMPWWGWIIVVLAVGFLFKGFRK